MNDPKDTIFEYGDEEDKPKTREESAAEQKANDPDSHANPTELAEAAEGTPAGADTNAV